MRLRILRSKIFRLNKGGDKRQNEMNYDVKTKVLIRTISDHWVFQNYIAKKKNTCISY